LNTNKNLTEYSKEL